MKMMIKPMLFTFVFTCMTFFMSCNNEELFIEPNNETVVESETPNEDTDPVIDVSTPCDFNLNTVQSGDTVVINCVMDLGGQSITLPANVTIVYEGGDIINGTINFANDTVISGEFLNPTLTLGGSKPLVKDSVFNFNPKRWGIVEGVVSDEIANKNTDIINQTISLIKELGVNTFKIDKMDAYFGVDATDDHHAIRLPSNFNLQMAENTNLRVQPNGYPEYSLIFCWRDENITISGGKLWGDRYKHDYTTISGYHDWGHVIEFKGVHNAVVDNVEMHEGSGDGIEVYGVSDRNADGSLKPDKWESFNVTVKNCLINDNRRNNISICDGTNIFIENNTIISAGGGSSGTKSDGTSPQAGIDVESREKKAPDGNSIYEWEKTDNVHIRNNIFEDNVACDIALLSNENTYVYGNTFRSKRGIATAGSSHCKIYDNTFESAEGVISGSIAIGLQPRYWADGTQRITGFEVNNNTITGYQNAIMAGGKNHTFKDNTITDCKIGILLLRSEDLVFDNTIISSNITASIGYTSSQEEDSMKNLLIKNGETNVQDWALYLSTKNNDEAGDITIDNVDFNGDIRLKYAQNVTVKNSTFTDAIITDCSPVLMNNN